MSPHSLMIGLTYDLKDDYLADGYTDDETAEFDSIETIDALDCALRELGYNTDRIGHIRSLTRRLASGERWDMIFNIAEGVSGFGREAQVPALLDAYHIPYTFSDVLTLSLTLHKGMSKHVMRDLGIPTPDFAIVETTDQVAAIKLPFPVFAKPVAEGTGKGITSASKIESDDALEQACRKLLETYRQPVLLEAFLPGREFTVGMIGTGRDAYATDVMEVFLNPKADQGIYSYFNKKHYETLVEYRLADDPEAWQAGETALAAWRGLGCRDAGRIDLRSDRNGRPNIMEINPLAGLHPRHSDLPIIFALMGKSYMQLIELIMYSAVKRLPINHA